MKWRITFSTWEKAGARFRFGSPNPKPPPGQKGGLPLTCKQANRAKWKVIEVFFEDGVVIPEDPFRILKDCIIALNAESKRRRRFLRKRLKQFGRRNRQLVANDGK